MSDDIEELLISKLINKKDDYYTYNEQLKPHLFRSTHWLNIFSWLDAEYQQGNNFDLVKGLMEIKNVPNVDYLLSKCSSNDSWMHNTGTLIKSLENTYKHGKVKSMCQNALLELNSDEIDVQIKSIEDSILEMSRAEHGGIIELTEHLRDTIHMIERNSLSPGLSGITSGFESIDKFTGGWQPQDLIIVGGASSMGKTSFALALAHNAAKSGHGTVVFSYEMSSTQLVSRLLSAETCIDNRYLIKGTLTDEEWRSIHSATGVIEKAPLYIDECKSTELRYLLNKVRQYVITRDVKLVMIDYLQLVSNMQKGRSREQEVSVIARSLKNLAKELDITVIALSQLSRGVERNEGSRPMLSNLRESGEIEQAADAVVFVYRPEYYNIFADDEGNSVENMAEIIFAKGRNIGIGSKWLRWINYLTKFEDLSQKY